MLLYFAMVISGISLLVWSADRFTDGAAAIARNLGIPPLIVGLTIVAMGSSAPEVVVSINAALKGTPGLAIGNAIGSNIANVGLVLGIAALVVPLNVQSATLKREIPVLFSVMILAFMLIIDLHISKIDGVILLFSLGAYLTWLTRSAIKTRNKNDLMLEEIIEELPEQMPNWKASLWVVVGLILLQISSNLLVTGATEIASEFGVSDFLIGVTIVAVGTSLPELAASITGVLKGEHELAIGNVIGSNIFNLLAVLGVPAILTSVEVSRDALMIDYAFMFGITVAVCFMAWGQKNGPGEITRFEGAILLSLFIGYQAYQFLVASNA
ncbi:calcium/sodium antiporter [Aliikangiella coralliicola]|uniref:Calcium/sodium antiporter n=1 Tax=Aliikangiella coralliicola TaxID=2592383 RepID=A0A545UJZ9_9GAMM|nr:calcium/sodium antiporter [Aliikangiella coralliicola]TQV89792.1 calcium/sodium antiporter [Aliikangiella coralliicola]